MAYPRNLNRLCKWRTVLVGRLLGTRPDSDPQTQGYRDLIDKMLVLRVEVTALTRLLLQNGIITEEGFKVAVEDEADMLEKDYQKRFPGVRATDTGLDIDIVKFRETTKGWPL
jgi:hypothetical protein